MKTCENCNKELTGQRQKYCSQQCGNAVRNKNFTVSVTCPSCGKVRSKRVRPYEQGKPARICRSCSGKEKMLRFDWSGPNSPTWRGGIANWQPGRRGRDKEGLSWKTQRRLAWERDEYTCQICGKKKDEWKPQVHHIKPWRVSFSHSLENLKCLCNSCHRKAEVKTLEMWPGITPTCYRPKRLVSNKKMGKIKRLVRYLKRGIAMKKAQQLRQQGLSFPQIAKALGHKSPAYSFYLLRGRSVGV